MPTLVILATPETTLADAWERQLPPGRIVLRLGPQMFPAGSSPGFAAVIVLDAVSELTIPASLARCPVIFVGEPRSLPFEQAKIAGRGKVYLSYDESTTRLGEFLPLVEELAEKQTMVEMLVEKRARSEPPRQSPRALAADAAELWDLVEGAIETLDTRDRLIAEFRRASRHLLRASHTVFFLREADGFQADRGTSYFNANDPLVEFFETHPTVVDGTCWDYPANPVCELAVRNRLALWGARMLVPIHDNARMLGLIALGVRDDGQAYDEGDRATAVFFARLLRLALGKSSQYARLQHLSEEVTIGAKYLPATLVLTADESPPRYVPLVVKDMIGRVRRTKHVCRISASEDQPFRGSAGMVAETGGIWASWEEASSEVHDAIARERAARRQILRELSLTLSHELGNALVSLATFRQIGTDRQLPSALIETIKNDVAHLEALNRTLGLMQGFHEAEPTDVDIRDIVQHIGHSLGVRVEVGPDPVVISASRKLLEFAFRALIRTVGENRPDHGLRELALKVRSTGSGPDLTALLSLKGKQLELEGILPEPADSAVPNQGRMGVFLAKEILRLHQGEIHAGPGLEGTEILISVKKW